MAPKARRGVARAKAKAKAKAKAVAARRAKNQKRGARRAALAQLNAIAVDVGAVAAQVDLCK